MAGKITGLTANTPDNLLLDAGAFFKNYEYGTDTPETAKAKLIGATAGGGSFSAVPAIRQIEIDGVAGAVKGLEALDSWAVTMTANVKEVTVESLKLALGAAKSSSTTGATKIEGRDYIDDEDYCNNIAWVGRLKGSEKPVVIIINNALSVNGLSLTFADASEAVIPMTITGHYDYSDLNTPPFEIYYPAE